MATPAIQTLITDAQQVLNLKSLSEIRATMAAALANANVGTPLNPNLTTQQLWDEFYLIVRQPESDIESIITNQLMKFLFAPPAPGGLSGDGQVIFNAGGFLAGDAGLTYNQATNALTISGDLTVGTNALKVFPATNRVLINQTTAIQGDSLEVSAKSNAGAISLFGRASDNSSVISFRANGAVTQKAAIQGNDGGLDFVTGTTIKQSINSTTGDVTVSLGNLVMGTANKGIDFSINSDPSATSELLNDYEEGTWTPVIADAATGGNVGTYTNNGSTYTKIGNQVTVQTYLGLINTTGMTGANALIIRGLPFVSVRGGQGNFYTYRVGRNALTVSSSVFVAVGVSHAGLNLYGTNSATTDLRILVSDIVSGVSEIILTVTYFA